MCVRGCGWEGGCGVGVDWEWLFVGGVEGREGLDGRGVNDVIICGKTCDDTFIIVMYAPQASFAVGMPSEDAQLRMAATLTKAQEPGQVLTEQEARAFANAYHDVIICLNKRQNR